MEIDFTGFIPAVSVRNLRTYNTGFEWWKKDTKGFYYPYILISAYESVTAGEIYNVREELGKDIFIFGDSGGWQQRTSKGEKLDPIEILRWIEKNCNIGAYLDVPYMSEKENFKEIVRQTAKDYEIMARNRTNYDIKFIKPFHGGTIAEFEYYYQHVKDIPADGWGLGPKFKPFTIHTALMYSFLVNKGFEEGWLHIFAKTGVRDFPLIYYIKAMHGKEFSFDSSSWINFSRFRRYFYLTDYCSVDILIGKRLNRLKDKIITINLENYEEFEGKMMPCICPVCLSMRFNKKLLEQSSLELNLHNFYVLLLYSLQFDFLSSDPSALEIAVEIIHGKESEIWHAIQIVKLGVEEGFRKAYEYYKYTYLPNLKSKVKEKTVFQDKLI